MDNKFPSDKSIDIVLSFFQQRPDVAGFVVQKSEDKIEFDGYFSDEFLGQTSEETYSTMITVIAAMRAVAASLTKRMVNLSGLSEDEVKKHIAEMYYEITKITRDPLSADESTKDKN